MSDKGAIALLSWFSDPPSPVPCCPTATYSYPFEFWGPFASYFKPSDHLNEVEAVKWDFFFFCWLAGVSLTHNSPISKWMLSEVWRSRGPSAGVGKAAVSMHSSWMDPSSVPLWWWVQYIHLYDFQWQWLPPRVLSSSLVSLHSFPLTWASILTFVAKSYFQEHRMNSALETKRKQWVYCDFFFFFK